MINYQDSEFKFPNNKKVKRLHLFRNLKSIGWEISITENSCYIKEPHHHGNDYYSCIASTRLEAVLDVIVQFYTKGYPKDGYFKEYIIDKFK